MAVSRLTVDDVDWAVEVLGRRRDALLPHAPIFWAPAEGAPGTHAAYLRHLLIEGGARGYRTQDSVIVAARDRGRLLVDDAAWSVGDGPQLWDALAGDHEGQPVRVVCPRYEPDRLALVLSTGASVRETWWLLELPGSGGGTPGEVVSLPGAQARTVPAPPVYAPPGPVLFLPQYDDLAVAAPAAVVAAKRLGCACVVVAVPEDAGTPVDLARAGLRPHCDFVEGALAPVRD